MGDIIETSIWHNARNKFYKVSSSGVFFEVKSANAAAVGLAKKPGDTCDVWVLCGFDCTWVPIHTYVGRTPVGAVEAGSGNYDYLYVGRAYYNGHLIPGKVDPLKKVCFICYEGKEVPLEEYEILVDSTENAHSVNSVFVAHIDAYDVPNIRFHTGENFNEHYAEVQPYDIDDSINRAHEDVGPNENIDGNEDIDPDLGDFFPEDDH